MRRQNPTPSQPKLCYSVKETVALTGICRAKLYKEIKAGRLRITKIGKRTVILAGALNEFISGSPNTQATAV